jgi:subtilase family serine protease
LFLTIYVYYMKFFTSIYLRIFLLFFFIELALPPARVLAQTYQLPVTGAASYTTCTGTLYDDGGPTGPYDTNATGTLTLLPGAAGGKLKLDFTLFELDSLRTSVLVYDGSTTNAPLIGQFFNGRPTVYATSSSGALTVMLKDYGGLPQRGFAATISCVTSIPRPDLAVRRLELATAMVLAGDNFPATAHIANLAGRPTPYRLTYLLSADTDRSADDVVLYTSTAALVAGTWADDYPPLQMPAGTAPGSYYLLCVAEATGPVAEANDTNNTAYAAMRILAPTPAVDLAVTDVDAPSQPLAPGSSFEVSARLQNFGTVLALTSQLGYYLSADAVLSTDDQLVGAAVVEPPTNGKFAQTGSLLSLPTGTGPGQYYLLAVADYPDELIEDNELNNVFAQPLAVGAPSIDVYFDRFRSLTPSQPAAGGTVLVEYYLINGSNVPLDSARVGYFLSADRTFSPDDVLLGQETVDLRLPGLLREVYVERTLTIPVPTPLGKRYVLLVSDYRNQLAESNETNNTLAFPLEIVVPAIDLTISALALASTSPPEVGSALINRFTLNNLGTTESYPTLVGYYLSADNQLSADDQWLGELPVAPLAGGSSQAVDVYNSGRPVIPASTVPGQYYLLAVADYLHQMRETNSANNLAALAIRVGRPNIDLLLAGAFDVRPARVPAGTQAQAAYYMWNAGTSAAYLPGVGFYLSTDPVLSPEDVLIGSYQLTYGNSIYPASGFNQESTLTIPRATAPGQYYVLGVADYQHEFAETNETNNVRAAALEVTPTRPDLLLVANPYVAPKPAVAGSPITTESYVYNVGARLAEPSAVGYYLSADPVLSPDDVLVGSTPGIEVEAGYSAIVTGTFTLPAATAGGRYYVLFVADYLNQLAESNETNNTNYAMLLVLVPGADLRMQSLSTEAVAGSTDSQVNATCAIFNGGAAVAASSSLGFYLSTRPTFDTSAVLLSILPGSALAAGSAAPRTATLTVPAGTAAGSYYLLVVADPLDAVAEANEHDNTAYLPLVVPPPFSGPVVPASGEATLAACAGRVYDSGGPGNYPSTANGTLTILPSTAGALVRLAFRAFETEPGLAYLQVYDGLTTSAPLLGTYSGSQRAGQGPGTIMASNTSTTGALTLRFVSTGATTAAGFEASISCSQRLAAREQTAGYALSVSPNPVVGPTPLRVQLSGQGPRSEATLTLLNGLGQQVATQQLTLLPGRLNQADIDTRGLAAGVYLLRLTGPELNATHRLVVE